MAIRANQEFFVDLDLQDNWIHNIRDAVIRTDAPSWGQVTDAITNIVGTSSHPAATAGVGIVNDLTPISQVISVDTSFVQSIVDTSIAAIDHPVDAVTGTPPINVDSTTTPGTSVISLDQAVIDNFHVAATAGIGIKPIDATQRIAVDVSQLGAWIPVTSVVGEYGVTASAPVDGEVTVSAQKDPVTAGNILVVSDLGLYVPVTDLTGYATTSYVDTADNLLTNRITNLTITSDGSIAVVEGVDTWNLSVNSLSLSNVYTGVLGTDTGTINIDLIGQNIPILEPGDIYVNTATGTAFICTNGTSPYDAEWTELATPSPVVTMVNGTPGQITSSNPNGPSTTIGLDSAIMTAINNSTADNILQDTRLLGLEAISHVPAVGATGTAIMVDPSTQAVALVLDPTSPATLTQSASGLSVDLGTAGANSHLPAAGTPGEIEVADNATNQVVGFDPLFRDRMFRIEDTNGKQSVAIAAMLAMQHPPAWSPTGPTGPVGPTVPPAGAIVVEPDTQQIMLLTDSASEAILSQSVAGLKVDLGIVGTNAHLPATGTPGEITVGPIPQRIGLDPVFKASVMPTPPQPLTFSPTADGWQATTVGPAGAATTVRIEGCVAMLNVCDLGSGIYTVSANSDPSVDGVVMLHFG